MDYKNFLRETLNFLHLDLTKNLEYDRLTKAIMKQSISIDSNCIDIGCHKGEILDIMLKHSPNSMGCAIEIENIFKDAGFPENLFTNIIVSQEEVPDISKKVIEHPLIAAS